MPARRAFVAAVLDGRGGWFVGGSFTRLGGQPRVALARLLPSGVDPAWRASIGSASGRPVAIYALARAGSRLFVAGPFGRVGGLPRQRQLRADRGCAAERRRRARPAHGRPRCGLEARLYLGGLSGLWALDARTGALLRLPRIDSPRQVLSLVTSQQRLLVAGRD